MPVRDSWDLKKKRFAVYGAIFLILAIQIMKIGNFPGLYFDAILPDYIAVQLLYPQKYQTMWQAAWPWLSQIYHGSPGILLTALSIMITGHTSILQHHIVYGIVAGSSLCVLFRILTHKRVGLSTRWAGTTVILLSVWPSLLNIIITQYHIELFGSLCMLAGVYLFLNWMDNQPKQGLIFASFFLFGVAFYAYFNFLFFLPSLFILTWIQSKERRLVFLDRLILYMISFVAGCGFYCIGYIQIAFSAYGIMLDDFGKLLVFFVFYALLSLFFIAFYKQVRFRYWALCFPVIAVAFGVWKMLPVVGTYTGTMHVFGDTSLGLWERVSRIYADFNNILSGRIAEDLIFGYSVTVFNTKFLFLGIILCILTFILELISKRYSMHWKAVLGIVAVYLLCGLAFANRMSPQHYVPLLFVSFALASMAVHSCVKSIKALVQEHRYLKGLRITGIIVLCFMFLLGIFNEARMINEIRTTRGYGKYSSQLTDLANNAMQNAANGDAELYVFYDWGFFTGFNYLTMNNVPFITVLDQNEAAAFYQSGGDIVACFWNSEDQDLYIAFMKEVSGETGDIQFSAKMDTNGTAAFYEVRLSHP